MVSRFSKESSLISFLFKGLRLIADYKINEKSISKQSRMRSFSVDTNKLWGQLNSTSVRFQNGKQWSLLILVFRIVRIDQTKSTRGTKRWVLWYGEKRSIATAAGCDAWSVVGYPSIFVTLPKLSETKFLPKTPPPPPPPPEYKQSGLHL